MFQANPLALLLGFANLSLLITAYVTSRRSSSQTARLYVYLLLAGSANLLFYALELSSTTLEWVMVWVRLENTAWVCVSAIAIWFLASYVRKEQWLRLPYVRIPLIVTPVLHLLLVWTNEWHGLAYTHTGVVMIDGLVYFDRLYGGGFLLTSATMIIMLYTMLIATLIHLWRGGVLYIRQGVPLIIAGVLISLGIGLTVLTDGTAYSNIDLAGIALALACIPLGWSIFRERLFQIIPTAHKWIIESMRDPIIILDLDGWIVDLNGTAGELLHISPELARGKKIQELSPDIALLLSTTPASTSHEPIEFLLHPVEGIDVSYEYQHLTVTSPQGVEVGSALILRDISSRKQAQNQALKLELEREKVRVARDLVVGIAHDFRTPLSEINLKAYLLSASGDTNKRKTILGEINERIHYIDDLIADMHFIIDLQTGANLETCEQVRFDDLRSTVTTYLAKICAEASLTFVDECTPNNAVIFCNPYHIDRALREIADNAGKFTPGGGTVTLRNSVRRSSVAIEFEDTGSGIEPDDLPHIFEWFYKPAARTAGGAGIGLPICKSIIEQHGGTISVVSTPGKGSRFTVELPRLHNPVSVISPRPV